MPDTQIVIGAGEVGTALARVLGDVHLRDLTLTGPDTADVLHICYPWDPAFTDITRTYQLEYGAWLVIVHSTVPVGTCDPHGWVHSPIRGRHPDLVTGIKTFAKHFGGQQAGIAAGIFTRLGIETHMTPLAATTEAGKLWELVQYGLQIRVAQQIAAWCEAHKLDFDQVYTAMADTYNAGYHRLGQEQFIRPVLEAVPGPIGGHCVVPAAEMLAHPLAALVRLEE